MFKNKVIKSLLGVSATVALLGALSAHAQTTKPPVTGEPNDHTSPGALIQPDGKAKPMTRTMKPGIKPPVVGEPDDHTSSGAMVRPEGKVRPMKQKKVRPRVKPPVVGEPNDHTASGGTTEAAKAAKAAKAPGM